MWLEFRRVLFRSDGAIKEIASKLTNKKSLILHTSGATDISVLKDCNIHSYGVLYPLMTLSINKEIDIKIVPFLIEASGTKEIDILINIVNSFKAEYKICTSDERLKMHTAAVFGTNFINYILSLAYDISHPDFVFLLPSVIETVRKAFLINPKVSQTGPAVREDMETINKHIKYLASKNLLKEEEVYKFLTNNIIDKFAVKNE